MNSIRDGLVNAGLISKREAELTAGLAAPHAGSAKSANEVERRLDILKCCQNPDQFRREARKVLVAKPSMINIVLNLAHANGMRTKHNQGGGRLIANLMQLREELNDVRLSEVQRIQIATMFSAK